MASPNSEEELDLISKLPDELLVKVLSERFTLKEAARTSVLSSRWRNLWKSAEDLDLNFDGSKSLSEIYDGPKKWSSCNKPLLATKRKRFINWVNGVVGELQNRPQKIRRFRVLFDLSNNCNSEGDVDRWLEFAISKRVESLHIVFRWTDPLYNFSEDCYNHIKTPAGSSQIKSLRSLRLSSVEVRNGILEHILATCSLLEELAVDSSEYLLTKLKVAGHSQLKHLEIRDCVELESMEVDNMPRLTRMVYVHHFFTGDYFRVSNCPCLVDLTLGCTRSRFEFMYGIFSGFAGQLESLLLRIEPMGLPLLDFTEHTRLEQLTFQVTNEWDKYRIHGLISFINACPSLHTLEFFLHTTKNYPPSYPEWREPKRVITRRGSIKVVKIVGFRGYMLECDLVEYVMEYFDGLETVVLDRGLGGPYFFDGSTSGTRENPCSEKQACAALKLALEFKSRAPQSVEFIVI